MTRFYLGLFLISLTTVLACAQAMETVTVVGSRRDVARENLPYSVSVLNQDEIQSKFVRSLPEALAQVPGVMVQQSANGQGAPYLRGFTGYRTLSLIDGVRYNNSVYRDGPNEYFSLIDFNAVDSIEIFGGPSSVLYGSDAIGGAVYLRSRHSDFDDKAPGERFIHGLQRISFASIDDSRQSRSELRFGVGRSWGLHLGYSLKDFGDLASADLGKQHNTSYGERARDTRFDANLGNRWRVTAAYQALDQDDVWRSFATQFAQSFAGTTVGSDLRRVKDQHRSLGYVRLSADELFTSLHRVRLTLSRQQWDEDGDRQRGDGRRSFESFDSTMWGLDLQLDSSLGPLDLIYGFDYYRDSVDSARRDFLSNGRLDRIRIQGPVGDDARFVQRGGYIEGVLDLSSRWRLQFGTRYTRVSAKIGRFEDPDTQSASSFSDDWGELVSSLRTSWFFGHDLKRSLWAGISESFRAPNVADLSRFGASRSNEIEIAATSLDPEKFLTGEFGIRHTDEFSTLSATAYYTRIRDYITSTPTGRLDGTMIEVSKRNSGSGYVQGVELGASRRWRAGFSIWGNLTWLEGRLETADSLNGLTERRDPLSRVMPLTFNGGIKWRAPDDAWRAALDITIAQKADKLSLGDKTDTQRIPPGGTPGYEVLKVSVGKRFANNFNLDLAGTNLLNARYRTHGSGVNGAGLGVDLRLTAEF